MADVYDKAIERIQQLTEPPTILIADDEPAIRTALGDIFKNKGYRVLEAQDGGEALEEYRNNNKPTLVFLDVRMPKMTGAEVFREIRKLCPEQSIVILTAWPEDVLDIVTNGWTTVLRKPFDVTELESLLNGILKP